jgi:hypothetical protein
MIFLGVSLVIDSGRAIRGFGLILRSHGSLLVADEALEIDRDHFYPSRDSYVFTHFFHQKTKM